MSSNSSSSSTAALLAALAGGATLAVGVLLWDIRSSRKRNSPSVPSPTAARTTRRDGDALLRTLLAQKRDQQEQHSGRTRSNTHTLEERRSGLDARDSTNPEQWTVEDVITWAEIEELPRSIVDVLAEQQIDGPTLLGLDEAQCEEIGIEVFGLKKRLLRSIQKIQQRPITQAPSGNLPEQQSPVPPASHAVTGGVDSVDVSTRAGILHQQLEKVHSAIHNDQFQQLPKERQAVLVSACLQVLQKVMTASETLGEHERVAVLRHIKSIFQELEQHDLTIEQRDDEVAEETVPANAVPRPVATNTARTPRNPLAPTVPPGIHGNDPVLLLLERIHSGLLDDTIIKSSHDLLPFSDALEKLIKGPAEMLESNAVMSKLRVCMELLVQRSKALTEKESGKEEGNKQKRSQPTASVTHTASTINSPAEALSQQLTQIYSVISSASFRAAPLEKRREHIESMYPLMARVESILGTLSPEHAAQIQPQLDDVYSLLESAMGNGEQDNEEEDNEDEFEQDDESVGAATQSVHTQREQLEVAHAASSNELVTSLTSLLETIRTKTFTELLELKPYAEAVQRLMQSQAVLSNPEMCRLIQLCMTTLVEKSQALQPDATETSAGEGERRPPVPNEGGISPAMTTLSEQLDRSIAILRSPIYLTLSPEKQVSLRQTSLELLEVLAPELDRLSMEERRSILKKASELSQLLRREQDRESESSAYDASSASGGKTAVPVSKKSQAMRQLIDIMHHSEFRSLPTRQQFDVMRQLMLVLQSLTPEEAIHERSMVEEAMQTVELVQGHIQRSSSSITHSSHIIDLLPRITERLMVEDFEQTTSPFELLCILKILHVGQTLLADLTPDTRATLSEILAPIEEIVQGKVSHLTGESIRKTFGADYRSGSEISRYSLLKKKDESDRRHVTIHVLGDLAREENDTEEDTEWMNTELEANTNHTVDSRIPDVKVTPHDVAVICAVDPEAQTSLHILVNGLEEHGFCVLCVDAKADSTEDTTTSRLKEAVQKAVKHIRSSRATSKDDYTKDGARLFICELHDAARSPRTEEELQTLLFQEVPEDLNVVYVQQSNTFVHLAQRCASSHHPEIDETRPVEDWIVRLESGVSDLLLPSFPFTSPIRGHFLEALVHDHGVVRDADEPLSCADILLSLLSRLCPNQCVDGDVSVNIFARELHAPFFRPLNGKI